MSAALSDDWPQLKNPAPATITVDGFPIHDYLKMVRDQMEILRGVVHKQDTALNSLTKKSEDDSVRYDSLMQRNAELEQRITVLEKQIDLQSESKVEDTLSHHSKQILSLIDRPIIDPEQTYRLGVVEKKLASFYGDETNILGRVGHLEHLQKEDKEAKNALEREVNNLSTMSTEHGNAIQSIQEDLGTHRDKLNQLYNGKVDINDLESAVSHVLSSRSVPTDSDMTQVRDELTAMADKLHKEFEGLSDKTLTDIDGIQQRMGALEDDVIETKNNPTTAITCFGSDQSARLAAIEGKLGTYDGSIELIDDMRARLVKSEDSLSSIMPSLTRGEEEHNRTKNALDRMETDYVRVARMLELMRVDVNAIEKRIDDDIGSSIKILFEKKPDAVEVEKIVSSMLYKKYMAGELPSDERPKQIDGGGVHDEDVTKLKDFVRSLERRVLVLASECREGLELLQGATDKKIETLVKWITRNKNESEQTDGHNTDIGVTRCLACDTVSSSVNPKVIFGEKNKKPNSHDDSRKSKSKKNEDVYRIKVPEILRSTVSRSRDGNPYSAEYPADGDTHRTSREANGDDGLNIDLSKILHPDPSQRQDQVPLRGFPPGRPRSATGRLRRSEYKATH
mmetsp:Transcript_5195/g.7981  ORF Transcript_5195/g.7981 Transcript_5195/m.7981 type:complete len:623 (+) Transcript_5195:123-1991(+)